MRTNRWSRWRVWRSACLVMTATVAAVAMLSTSMSGCVRVKPYQREALAKSKMIEDRDVGERRFDQHARGSREGSDGGTGVAGGGCGCN